MPRPKKAETPSEVLTALVVSRTADGFVVGRVLVEAKYVEWITPKHVRDVLETRPKDIVITAEKWANEDGTVTLKPKKVNKGAPVLTTVAKQIVFGEALDSASHRARNELGKQVQAVARQHTPHWRHICPDSLTQDMPTQLAIPVGKACDKCGAEDRRKVSAA